MEQRLRYVRVTNKFDVPYVDMYDGIPVTIDPGGTQELRPEQALHLFGYVEGANKRQMLLHTAKRQGWNTSEHLKADDSGKTLAERMFDRLQIEPVTFKLVEEKQQNGDEAVLAERLSEDAAVEHAAPPPRFTPAKPQAKPAPPKGRGRQHDDDC